MHVIQPFVLIVVIASAACSEDMSERGATLDECTRYTCCSMRRWRLQSEVLVLWGALGEVTTALSSDVALNKEVMMCVCVP